jgi:hypothetical protein
MLPGGVFANVEGFVAPATFVELGVEEELNGLLLCQGHFVPAQPEAMHAKATTHAHWDKKLRIIRESFARDKKEVRSFDDLLSTARNGRIHP